MAIVKLAARSKGNRRRLVCARCNRSESNESTSLTNKALMKSINMCLNALRRTQLDFLLLAFLALGSLSASGSPPPSGVAPINLPAGGFHIDGNLLPNAPAAGVGDWL